MGENADDMIEGLCCSGCGVYFEEAHGYPVLCRGCKKADPDSEIQEAEHDEL